MCSSMKQPKPDRLVEIDGIPMTVHSADGDPNSNILLLYNIPNQTKPQKHLFSAHESYLVCSPKAHSKRERHQGGILLQTLHNPSEVEERWMKGTLDGR